MRLLFVGSRCKLNVDCGVTVRKPSLFVTVILLSPFCDVVQLWTDYETLWEEIEHPLNITKWTLEADPNVVLDLDEYLFPAIGPPYESLISTSIIPYAQNPFTQQDQAARFDNPKISPLGRTSSITVELNYGLPGGDEYLCPITSTTFTSNANSPLRIGDSVTISFSARDPPVRVKICGRYQPNPGVNNGMPGQYTFTHTVRSTDSSGPCSLALYLPWIRNALPVYSEPTGFSVGALT